MAHAGGLTHLQRIAHFAEVYHVRTACHGPTDLSPINLAATVHFQTAVHNFGLQEYMRHPAQAEEVFDVGYWFEDGMLHVDERPGLGVEFRRGAGGGVSVSTGVPARRPARSTARAQLVTSTRET